MNMWVLTKTYNDYDQHGDYLVIVWDHKPTIKEISNVADCNLKLANHILNGGGRIEFENQWFNLKEINSGELYVHSIGI